ncbi:hypothetical protein, partial [Pseudomonas aeruginosa]|uniref:hypothetical protein n=1 Tax=Pseudomonas aeruginosa TaxID=287 RepID=UPI0019D479B8
LPAPFCGSGAARHLLASCSAAGQPAGVAGMDDGAIHPASPSTDLAYLAADIHQCALELSAFRGGEQATSSLGKFSIELIIIRV